MDHLPVLEEAKRIWKQRPYIYGQDDIQKPRSPEKMLGSLFSVGDYYYHIFNVPQHRYELVSDEIRDVLGYEPPELTVENLVAWIHPDDYGWFLAIESKIVEFFQSRTYDEMLRYKVRYDARLRKKNGEYIRILQQFVVLCANPEQNDLKVLGMHTDITHLKAEGKPMLSFIGLEGAPSFINVDVGQPFSINEEPLFTSREKEVLTLLMKGKSSKDIAGEFGISHETVNTHRRKMLAKTGARNTPELIHLAVQKGWI